jgi:hypothetical protein
MAAYVATDVVTWTGKEVGFRFPLDRDEVAFYLQKPFFFQEWNEYSVKIPQQYKKCIYTIKFKKIFSRWYHVTLSVLSPTEKLDVYKERTASCWLPQNTLSLAIVTHNWSETFLQEEFYLKIWDNVKIFPVEH